MFERWFAVPVVVLMVLAGGCGGEETDDDQAVVIGQQSDDDDGSDGEGEGDGQDDASGAGSEDLMVVWPLPAGDYQVWLPYQLIDDEFQYSESASFQTMSISMDDVVAFYLDYFPTIGLIPDELELGGSIALNLTNPDDPLWTGVMQTGVDPDGYVTINQNYTDPKEQTETSTVESDGSVSSDSSGEASEDG